MERISELMEELAPVAAKALPDGKADRARRLAEFRDAGIEIAALAHWALSEGQLRTPE